MATHDYVIANGTGAAVRSDLNNALAAIVSNNSGSSEPGTTYAYQWWADTNANVLKIRNSANDGWITLRELDGTMLIEDGDASTPGLAFADDVNTGIFSPAADQIGFATGGAERLEIGSSEVVFNDPSNDVDFRVESNSNTHMLFVDAGNDRIGINNSSPGQLLHITSSGEGQIRFADGSRATALGSTGSIGFVGSVTAANGFAFYAGDSEAGRFKSTGQFMLGTATEGDAQADNLTIADSANCGITIRSGTSNKGQIYFSDSTSGDGESIGRLVYSHSDNAMFFTTNSEEGMRLDSSGRLLVGTDSASTAIRAAFQASSGGTGGGVILISRGTATPTNNQSLGEIYFADSGHAQSAVIGARRDGGTWTSGSSQPTYLRFDTTADGASSSTERARLDSAGNWLVGKGSSPSTSISTAGAMMMENGRFNAATDGGSILNINRLTNDGNLCQFYQDTDIQGSISVSGTTVSYNGAHLARWSQLASGAARTEILRGSVLSNLDEMCEWVHAAQDAVLYTEEDELPEGVSVGDVKTPAVDAYTENNEQLNRMKVSDVEGDVNVAGVFQAWDDDDDTYTNDFYCAMTGDFVIRIAQGTTVARGDLLMSAGDGTAKPQDDDIVRSKTIAKVTSTTVSTTYSDGSYCVPCVLMAC